MERWWRASSLAPLLLLLVCDAGGRKTTSDGGVLRSGGVVVSRGAAGWPSRTFGDLADAHRSALPLREGTPPPPHRPEGGGDKQGKTKARAAVHIPLVSHPAHHLPLAQEQQEDEEERAATLGERGAEAALLSLRETEVDFGVRDGADMALYLGEGGGEGEHEVGEWVDEERKGGEGGGRGEWRRPFSFSHTSALGAVPSLGVATRRDGQAHGRQQQSQRQHPQQQQRQQKKTGKQQEGVAHHGDTDRGGFQRAVHRSARGGSPLSSWSASFSSFAPLHVQPTARPPRPTLVTSAREALVSTLAMARRHGRLGNSGRDDLTRQLPASHLRLETTPPRSFLFSTLPTAPQLPNTHATSASSRYPTTVLPVASSTRASTAFASTLAPPAQHGFISYTATVSFGSPPQAHTLIIDTGSAALAVSGRDCFDVVLRAPCGHIASYSPGLSHTAKSSSTVDSMIYDKGFWEGPLYSDVVTVGGALTVNASFAAIRTTRDFFEQPVGNSGIWGLGPRPPGRPHRPLLDALVEDGHVPDDQFSLWLCGARGSLWLGARPAPLPQGISSSAIHFEPLVPAAHYTLLMRDIHVAGVPLHLVADPRAIVDSGSTFLVLPLSSYNAVVAALRHAVPSADPAVWEQYCIATEPALWPPITIALQNTTVTFYGSDYLNRQGKYYCLGISAMGRPLQAGAILGATALQGLYLEIDRANARVGLASARPERSDGGCGRPPAVWPPRVPSTLTRPAVAAALSAPALSAETCTECLAREGLWCSEGDVEMWIDGKMTMINGSAGAGLCWPSSSPSFTLSPFSLSSILGADVLPDALRGDLVGLGPAMVLARCRVQPQRLQCHVPQSLVPVTLVALACVIVLLWMLAARACLSASDPAQQHSMTDAVGCVDNSTAKMVTCDGVCEAAKGEGEKMIAVVPAVEVLLAVYPSDTTLCIPGMDVQGPAPSVAADAVLVDLS